MPEPGVPNVPQVDARVSRSAALRPESRGILAHGVRSPEQATILQQADQANLLIDNNPPRPLDTVRSLGELFGRKPAKSTEAAPRAQVEKRDATIVSKSGDPNLSAAESVKESQILVAGEVARRIIETRSLDSIRDTGNITQQIEALKILFPEIAGISLDDPNLIIAFANSELKNDQVFEAFVRRYNELQNREIPSDSKEAQEVVGKAAKAKAEAEARQRTASIEEARLAERRASLLPAPGVKGKLSEQLAELEARNDLTSNELKIAANRSENARKIWI